MVKSFQEVILNSEAGLAFYPNKLAGSIFFFFFIYLFIYFILLLFFFFFFI